MCLHLLHELCIHKDILNRIWININFQDGFHRRKKKKNEMRMVCLCQNQNFFVKFLSKLLIFYPLFMFTFMMLCIFRCYVLYLPLSVPCFPSKHLMICSILFSTFVHIVQHIILHLFPLSIFPSLAFSPSHF